MFLCHNSGMPPSTEPLPPAVRALLRHLRRQRPLRAGSLLVTIFGDAIAPRGAAVTLGSLIRLAAPFGVGERLARTSAARLAQLGWFATRRAGRRSEYRLTARGRERFSAATRRIYGGGSGTHGAGAWTLLVLPAAGSVSEALRAELHWRGFGAIHTRLYAHPALPEEAWLLRLAGRHGALLLRAAGALPTERRLVRRGWNLRELTAGYRRFLRRFSAVRRDLGRGAVAPRTAYIVRTLLVHEYRRIHLQDPQLPARLLPPDWVGERAFALAAQLYRRVFWPAERYVSEQARGLHRELPPPDAPARRRFGGVPHGPAGRRRRRRAP